MSYERSLHGSQLPQSKLNETLVRLIRRQHAEKQRARRELGARYSATAFAARYGVSPRTIEKVLMFATWRHVR